LKIALFTGNYNHIRDGVSLTLNRMVDFMQRNGVQMRIYAPSTPQPAIKPHSGELVVVPSIAIPGRKEYRMSLGFPKAIKKDCEAFNPDIVHIATPDFLGNAAIKWAFKKNIPVVSSFHTNFLSYLSYYKIIQPLEPLFARYFRNFYDKCTHIYVPSESMIEELGNQIDNSKAKLWARGVELDTFNPNHRNTDWRQKKGFSDDAIVITFVSRLVLEKDVDIYAKTVKLLQKKYPGKVKALVVGKGPAENEMRKWIPEAVFTGTLRGQELSTAYACSDIFLFPSISETFGNVTLEALASGVPSFVADAPGGKSLIKSGLNGCIGVPKNPEDFANKISPLIEDKNLRERFAVAARASAEHYSWDEINGTLLNYYQQIYSS
jgi:glycosyltransferase involved in cell wall biosynthesis